MLRSSPVNDPARLIAVSGLACGVMAYMLAAVGIWSGITSMLIGLLVACVLGFPLVWRDLRALYLWVFIVLLLAIALSTPTAGWDARSIWLLHAKRIFIDQSLYAQLDDYAQWSHNDYPSFVPLLMAGAGRLMGFWNEIFPKAMGVVILAPALIVIVSALQRTASVAIFVFSMTSIGGAYLVNGYLDMPVAIYSLAVVVCGVRIAQGDWSGWTSHALLGLLFSSLLLMKNEAAVLAALIASLVCGFALISKWRMPWVLAAVFCLAFVPLVAWKIAVAHHGVVNDLASGNIWQHLVERLPNVFYSVLVIRETVGRSWILVPCLMLVACWKYFRKSPLAIVGAAVSVTYSGVLYLVYMSTPHDVKWHLQTSVDRTVMPVMVILTFVAIYLVERLITPTSNIREN